jgi:hypothetical protein
MQTTAEMSAPAHTRMASHLLPDESLFDRLVSRVCYDHPAIDRPTSERIMEQTLAFLYACAGSPADTLTPSATIDIGWHTFILHTMDYADFYQRVAGRMVHHAPEDPRTATVDPTRLDETVARIRSAGLPVDDALWFGSRADATTAGDPAKCSQCHAGCHDSPKGSAAVA